MRCAGCFIWFLVLGALPAGALEPEEVVVVSNANLPQSQRIAEHYVGMRGLPKQNHVALSLPRGEDIARADYHRLIVRPLRKALLLRRNEIKCVVTVFGVPLRVGPRLLTKPEQAEETKLTDELKSIDLKTNAAHGTQLQARLRMLSTTESTAAVDSELMLLWWPDYPLARWMVNPLYFSITDEQRKLAPPVLMTARLDGPSPDIAIRLINDAIAVERLGLKGKVYIDARGMGFDPKQKGQSSTGYGGYDESFRETAELLKKGGLDVTLDNRPELFAPHSCPDCAIYTGWYSLANYIPCCEFARGAVAWHLASSEAVTLRNPKAKLWCPNLLQDGVAVTIGPVSEPYTMGFPKPAEFFAFLATGKYTVAECYAKTALFASWMGVLVGDPLYNPFAKHPLIAVEEIRSSPKGLGVKIEMVTGPK